LQETEKEATGLQDWKTIESANQQNKVIIIIIKPDHASSQSKRAKHCELTRKKGEVKQSTRCSSSSSSPNPNILVALSTLSPVSTMCNTSCWTWTGSENLMRGEMLRSVESLRTDIYPEGKKKKR
jgi:GTPase Era involved in 16S rRNA processing